MTRVLQDEWLELWQGDCRAELAQMAERSVQCVVTSPPYFGLRDYGIEPTVWEVPQVEHPGGHSFDPAREQKLSRTNAPGSPKQASNPGSLNVVSRSTSCDCGAWLGVLGLEPTIDLYVAHMVEVFRAVRRVLRDDGTLWLNLGDSYATGAGKVGDRPGGGARGDKWRETAPMTPANRMPQPGLKPKDLIGAPWRVAFALQADGWWLRRDIIWDKPNPMPESTRDRPSSSHEYIFQLTKSERYFYDGDAISEPATSAAESRWDGGGNGLGGGESHAGSGSSTRRFAAPRPGGWSTDERHDRIGDGRYPMPEEHAHNGFGGSSRRAGQPPIEIRRSARSVWRITTSPYPDAHFATFPPELPRRCIMAGTSERGCCPECGAPWRRIVAVDRAGAALPHDGDTKNAALYIDSTNRLGPGVQDTRSTSGWRPSCAHGSVDEAESRLALADSDFEIIPTPLAPDSVDKATRHTRRQVTGRRGLDRPRSDGEGTRPITRFEQRLYAQQLRALEGDARLELIQRFGETTWQHYVRTDPEGARPLPPAVLEELLERGVLTYVTPPAFVPLEPVPCVVLDPFAGSGTVGMVAQSLSRRAVLIDLSADYISQQLRRNAQAPLGLVAE